MDTKSGVGRPRLNKKKLQTWIPSDLDGEIEKIITRSGMKKTDVIEKILRVGIDTLSSRKRQAHCISRE